MKKLSTIFIALFFLATASACSATSSSRLSDTRFKDKRNVGDFTSIEVGGAMNVTVNIGSESSVEVIGDDHLISRVVTEVNGGTLEIGVKGRESFNGEVRVIITTPQLISAEVSGASHFKVYNLNNSTFTLDASGASHIFIEGSTNSLIVDGSGASHFDLSKFSASSANVDLSGACHGVFNVQNQFNVEASGASQVEYYGTPEIKTQVSGASRIKSIN